MATPMATPMATARPIPPMLRIEALTKGYGKAPRRRFFGLKLPRLGASGPGLAGLEPARLALDQLNLCLQPGEIYGLLGPNGAGKTTTINLICNLLQPSAGQIAIAGQPVSEQTKLLVGVVPQQNLLYGSLTCAENLNFFAQLYGLPRRGRRSRVAHCLGLVNLGDRAHSPAESLSGGMKRRLSIALALVHGPKLVILDEPTTGLDIEARYELWELIRQLRGQGVTILLTTHLLEEAERLCDRIGILRQGRLLREGSLDQLRQAVQAQAIALVDSADPAAVEQRAQTLGYPLRHYGNEIGLWLPEPLALQVLLEQLEGIAIAGVSIHPVRLEHLYLEITRA